MTRKVPCIAGCEGPMLMVMRSNISSPPAAPGGATSFGLVHLVLGEDPAPRRVVVLAQRMPLEGLVGEDAAQVRVAVEQEPEHVVGLALEPVGGLPHLVTARGSPAASRAPAPSGAGARRGAPNRGGRRPRNGRPPRRYGRGSRRRRVEQQVEPRRGVVAQRLGESRQRPGARRSRSADPRALPALSVGGPRQEEAAPGSTAGFPPPAGPRWPFRSCRAQRSTVVASGSIALVGASANAGAAGCGSAGDGSDRKPALFRRLRSRSTFSRSWRMP